MQSKLLKLVAECKSGNRQSEYQLYKLLAPKLLLMGMRYLKSRQEAEDCLQDTFVKLFKNISMYRAESSFETWATRIMINTALSKLKLNSKDAELADLSEAHFVTNESENDEQEYAELLTMLRSLPDKQRLVFNMYVIEGYSHKEIGEALEMEEATSRTNLMRAKEALKSTHGKINNYYNA